MLELQGSWDLVTILLTFQGAMAQSLQTIFKDLRICVTYGRYLSNQLGKQAFVEILWRKKYWPVRLYSISGLDVVFCSGSSSHLFTVLSSVDTLSLESIYLPRIFHHLNVTSVEYLNKLQKWRISAHLLSHVEKHSINYNVTKKAFYLQTCQKLIVNSIALHLFTCNATYWNQLHGIALLDCFSIEVQWCTWLVATQTWPSFHMMSFPGKSKQAWLLLTCVMDMVANVKKMNYLPSLLENQC